MTAFLTTPQKRKLAYNRLIGKSPGVVFMGGFRSDMTGSKAIALEEHCKKTGRAYVRFDYSGHGVSEGNFRDGTIGQWKEDAIAVLDMLTEGSQIIVGSSMGGWIMLLAAIARPERIAGLVGVAAAPDFTENLVWAEFTDKQRKELEKKGEVLLPDCYSKEDYPITKKLLEDGRKHLLLGKKIPISCPVRLLHGMSDEDVPWEFALGLNEKLESQDVKVNLILDGNHRLSEPKHLETLCKTVDKVVVIVEGNGSLPQKASR